ncbi:NUDIX domain-containing protein [Kutzneria sp. 744]|uniref:NUDIX hydrolase n=1 Tax=Kutzneria sp. (strain 744) TaxID=345341 RepID=UPI0004B6E61A|nr:NUDIX domain-containing protein [Kutzneria sp. 744]
MTETPFPAVSLELSRYDWGSLATCDGTAEDVPATVLALLAASTEEAARHHASDIDNVVMMQSNLFQSAVPTVSVLCAALTEDLMPHARSTVLWLLGEIVNADVHRSEVEAGRADLDVRARELARAGLWLFYRELRRGDPADTDVVLGIIQAVETDRARYELVLPQVDYHRRADNVFGLIDTVALVHVRDKRVLLVRTHGRKAFYLPGGKFEPGETDLVALTREVLEETGCALRPETVRPYGAFRGDAHGQVAGTQVRITTYTGEITGEPTANSEIAECGYHTYEEYSAMPETAPVVHAIVDDLHRHGLL